MPLAVNGEVVVVRDPLERRPSDALANLLGRDPRLGVTDDSVANLDAVHFGLESNKLDDRFALCLILNINKGYVTIAQSRDTITNMP